MEKRKIIVSICRRPEFSGVHFYVFLVENERILTYAEPVEAVFNKDKSIDYKTCFRIEQPPMLSIGPGYELEIYNDVNNKEFETVMMENKRLLKENAILKDVIQRMTALAGKEL